MPIASQVPVNADVVAGYASRLTHHQVSNREQTRHELVSSKTLVLYQFDFETGDGSGHNLRLTLNASTLGEIVEGRNVPIETEQRITRSPLSPGICAVAPNVADLST